MPGNRPNDDDSQESESEEAAASRGYPIWERIVAYPCDQALRLDEAHSNEHNGDQAADARRHRAWRSMYTGLRLSFGHGVFLCSGFVTSDDRGQPVGDQQSSAPGPEQGDAG